MELFQKYCKDALRHIQIADHMLYVTLPIVNENRLLLKIFQEIYKSLKSSIHALLELEKQLGRITGTDEEEQQYLQFFKIAKNYDISLELAKQCKEIIELHKSFEESSLEFIKKENLVIMSPTLTIRKIDRAHIKEYLSKVKEVCMIVIKKINSYG